MIASSACNEVRQPIDLTPLDVYQDPSTLQLVNAIIGGNNHKLERDLAQEVEVNRAGLYGITPLWWAVRSNRSRPVELLLRHGADPNAPIEGNRTSIVGSAAMMSNGDILRILLEHGGDPNSHSGGSLSTPIFNAIRADRIDNLRALIAAGADVNHQAEMGSTAAMSAARLRDTEKVRLLLDAGADTSIKDNFGKTLIDLLDRYDEQDDDASRLLSSIRANRRKQ